ncbi:GM22622 [Drosophila sechellia]|uniref:GM22622 n=1 Tax=Drosophila sechellia TaxID=7238 RepID=B4I6I0_DROSE|nr:GM22622 [Drosophila sechellia]
MLARLRVNNARQRSNKGAAALRVNKEQDHPAIAWKRQPLTTVSLQELNRRLAGPAGTGGCA